MHDIQNPMTGIEYLPLTHVIAEEQCRTMIIWRILQHVPATSIVLWRLCLVIENVSPMSYHTTDFMASAPGGLK